MDDSNPAPRRAVAGALMTLALATVAPPGCLGPVGTTATSALQKARQSNDPNVRMLAYQKLGSARAYDDEAQKVEAVKVLASRLDDSNEPPASRAVICRSLGELGRPEGRPPLLHALDDPEAIVRAEACRGLAHVGRPEDATALARIMSADTSLDGRVAAIEALGALKSPDPRIVESLVEGMEH